MKTNIKSTQGLTRSRLLTLMKWRFKWRTKWWNIYRTEQNIL